MGCAKSFKREHYTDNEYDEEVELRKFEEEVGGFKKSLNSVFPRICIEKDIIPITNAEDFILQEFSENLVHLIQQGYFYKVVEGRKYYDAKKIKLLIFLITNNSTIYNGKISYNDKASFIFTYIKTKEEQNLCDAIEEQEEGFINFINDLVDVACDGIVDSYIKYKNVQRDGYLNKLKSIKKETTQLIFKNLFFSKDQNNSPGITFDELNAKFSLDKFIFTSGFIREFAWEVLLKGKANELESKERVESKKEEKNN